MNCQALNTWLCSIATPAFFTFFGAVLGFLFAELKDRWRAHRTRAAFLKAVAIELGTIKKELQEAATSAEIFAQRVQESGYAPQLIPKWGTTVFDTQLGKLLDVADDVVFRTIKVYAAIGRIERIIVFVNDNSRDFVGARAGNEKADAQSRLRSALLVARDEANLALPSIDALLQELPGYKKPKR